MVYLSMLNHVGGAMPGVGLSWAMILGHSMVVMTADEVRVAQPMHAASPAFDLSPLESFDTKRSTVA